MNVKLHPLMHLALYGIACILSFSTHASENQDIESVSLTKLIVAPDDYVDSRIRVAGYLADRINFYLFLTENHAAMDDFESAILVSETDDGDLFQSGCGNNSVFLLGTLAKSEDSGYVLVNVEVIYDAFDKKVCWTADD